MISGDLLVQSSTTVNWRKLYCIVDKLVDTFDLQAPSFGLEEAFG